MPIFYQQEINPHTRLGIWKIEEDEAFFMQKVPSALQVTHPAKWLQHLAGRYLLQYLFPEFPYNEILIANTRKPYLPQAQFHFSISHSGGYAATIVSQQQRTGIDIELYSPKINLVKHKFLTEAELQLVSNQQAAVNGQQSTVNSQPPTTSQLSSINHILTLCWCCKEAVYKHWGAGGIDFKKHILIQSISTEIPAIYVLFTRQPAQLTVCYLLFNDLCLTWVIS